MSKSHKKTPVFNDGYGSKSLQYFKRAANKTVRRSKDVPNGKAYRKIYETWIFRDYSFMEPFAQYSAKINNDIKHFNAIGKDVPNYYKKLNGENLLKSWKKNYYWK